MFPFVYFQNGRVVNRATAEEPVSLSENELLSDTISTSYQVRNTAVSISCVMYQGIIYTTLRHAGLRL